MTSFFRLSTRLLHSGATTQDILHQYISLVKSLSIVDPSYSILSSCLLPVRTYLQSRSDTIRNIVSNFSDENSELYEELLKSEIDDRENRIDILDNLIGIYGKPELFISEYRSMLSEKLLSTTDFNVDKEVTKKNFVYFFKKKKLSKNGLLVETQNHLLKDPNSRAFESSIRRRSSP